MRVKGGIFSTPGRAWTAVVLYTAFLYSTLTLAFDLYVYVFDRMGRPFMSALMSGMYVPIGLLLLLFIYFRLPRKAGVYAAFLLVCLTVAYCLYALEVPAKRFHFVQYGPLTYLIFDALRFHVRDRSIYVWAQALVILIGLGDETLQGLLPDRYFGLTDVVVNSVAGLVTLAFIGFVMGEENYPWGKARRPL